MLIQKYQILIYKIKQIKEIKQIKQIKEVKLKKLKILMYVQVHIIYMKIIIINS